MSFGSSTDASMKPSLTLEFAMVLPARPTRRLFLFIGVGVAAPLFAHFIGNEQGPAAQAEPLHSDAQWRSTLL
jgi:hypothetical protein